MGLTSDFIEFSRNYLGVLPDDYVDTLIEALLDEGDFARKPGSVIGRFLFNSLGVSLLYSPREISRNQYRIYFENPLGYALHIKFQNHPNHTTELYLHERPTLKQVYYLTGIVLEALGIMKYDRIFSGAEAQDYSQNDSDAIEEPTIGYITE